MLVVMILLFAIPTAIFNGFVLTVLWDWFISELWGVRQITIAEGLGLALIVSFLTVRYNPNELHQDAHTLLKRLLVSFFTGVLALGFGWIYHLFI